VRLEIRPYNRESAMKNPFAHVESLLAVAHLLPLLMSANPVDAEASRGVPARSRRMVIAAPAEPMRAATAPPSRPAVAHAPRNPVDDDPDVETHAGTPAAAARDRERARCAAIVMSAVGLKHPAVAFALAFHTTQSVDEALAALDGISTGAFAHLAEKGSQGGASRYRAGPPH
jgi:transcriptional regulator GlxA family with amidase domain